MLTLLRNLETRFVEAKTIVLDEFEESNEVNFLQKGSIVVGYEINKIKRYCLMMKHRCVIGAYGVTFSVRSEFIYTSVQPCEMLYIRKANWFRVLSEHSTISTKLMGRVLFDYATSVK